MKVGAPMTRAPSFSVKIVLHKYSGGVDEPMGNAGSGNMLRPASHAPWTATLRFSRAKGVNPARSPKLTKGELRSIDGAQPSEHPIPAAPKRGLGLRRVDPITAKRGAESPNAM